MTWEKDDMIYLATAVDSKSDKQNAQIFLAGLLGDVDKESTFLPEMTATLEYDNTYASRAKSFMDYIRYQNMPSRISAWFSSLWSSKGYTGVVLPKTEKLQLIRCLYEGKFGEIIPTVQSVVHENGLDLSRIPGGLPPHHMEPVAYFLTNAAKHKIHTLQ